jgi:hypothetical protein
MLASLFRRRLNETERRQAYTNAPRRQGRIAKSRENFTEGNRQFVLKMKRVAHELISTALCQHQSSRFKTNPQSLHTRVHQAAILVFRVHPDTRLTLLLYCTASEHFIYFFSKKMYNGFPFVLDTFEVISIFKPSRDLRLNADFPALYYVAQKSLCSGNSNYQ